MNIISLISYLVGVAIILIFFINLFLRAKDNKNLISTSSIVLLVLSIIFIVTGVSVYYLYDKTSLTSASSSDLFLIKQNGKWGYIDDTGKIVIKPKYNNATNFTDGLASVMINGEKTDEGYVLGDWGCIDATGKVIIKTQYSSSIGFDKYGYALVNESNKSPNLFHHINKKGEYVSDNDVYTAIENDNSPKTLHRYNPAVYDKIEPRSNMTKEESEYIKKWGFKNSDNSTVIPVKYDWAYEFSEGYAVVVYNKFIWNYINEKGELLTKDGFRQAKDFKDGYAGIEDGDKWGVINNKGEIIIKPQFDDVGDESEGLIPVNVGAKPKRDTLLSTCFLNTPEGGKWGFINLKGEFVVQPQFDKVEPYHNGLARVILGNKSNSSLDTSGKWGYINKEGTFIWNPTE